MPNVEWSAVKFDPSSDRSFTQLVLFRVHSWETRFSRFQKWVQPRNSGTTSSKKKKPSKTFVASSQPGFSPLKNEIGILFVVVAVHVLFFLLLHFLFRSSRVQRIGGRSTHRDIIWTAASAFPFWILISFCFYFFLGRAWFTSSLPEDEPVCLTHTRKIIKKKNKIQREENQWPTTGRHECEQRKRTKAKRRGGRWPMAGLNSPPLFLDSVSVSSSLKKKYIFSKKVKSAFGSISDDERNSVEKMR